MLRNQFLASKLRRSVDAHGRRFIVDRVRTRLVAVKDVVGREVNESGADALSCLCDFTGRQSVHRVGQLGLVFGFAGLIAGPFVGAVAGEYWVRRDLRRAGEVGLGAWLGLILGGAAKLAVVFAMIALFAMAFVL